MNEWIDNNSGGGDSNPGVAFDDIGAKIVGVINTAPAIVDTQYGERMVMDLIADKASECTAGPDRNVVNAGDVVTLWIKPGAMTRAIKEALVNAGAGDPEVGGIIAVKYTGDGEKKPGRNAPKLYKATYQKPPTGTAGPDNDDLF